MLPLDPWRSIDNDAMLVMKGAIAAAGAVLLLTWAILHFKRKGRTLRAFRGKLLAPLLLLGACSFFAYWNFFHFHFDRYEHDWDSYHYYVGAKYFRELGYTRI